MTARATLQSLVNGLADRLGSPVILEDAEQQLVAYSPHYGVVDDMRQQTILRQTTAQPTSGKVIDAPDLSTKSGPFVVPADPRHDRSPRLGIPIRYLDSVLGYAWVLLRDEDVEPETISLAANVAEEISFTMLADSRTRVRESDTVLAAVSPDQNTRFHGLIDIESRPEFDVPRVFAVAVCSGPDWEASDTRGSFWTAAWGPAPQYQLRGSSATEGVVILSLREPERAGLDALMRRAFIHVTQQRPDPRLAIGVGGVVEVPADIHESHRQAQLAAKAALGGPELGPIARWDQLGVYRFLTQLPRDTLRSAVDPRLVRVAQQEPVLLETLECYLDHTGAITKVADELHIHRTTLYYRLSRLRELGIEPNSGADRLAIGSGLAALRLLGEIS
ncbi:PucR family transcriptional regulator [Euzebya tangerina]|uniref:PucR family transcriptional regulator n=1 Tax=Euzebya tangerina TaxID=591198 RepID=UPI000E323C3B|nr:helix-turn-helix domain-containing protein [Euzebya tangerina]